jgi:pyruvate formate lyase activating enzyme
MINKNLVDYIAMDLKDELLNYYWVSDMDRSNKLRESINIIMNSDKLKNYEFRTTVVPGIHTIKTIKKITKEIKDAKQYYIQNFRPDVVYRKKLKKIRRFSEEELARLKEAALKNVSNTKIRN